MPNLCSNPRSPACVRRTARVSRIRASHFISIQRASNADIARSVNFPVDVAAEIVEATVAAV